MTSPASSGSTGSTAGVQRLPAGAAPPLVVALLRRVEADHRIDGPAQALARVAAAAVPNRAVSDALRGTWLGHALHPLLADFPLGAWMSASLLDLVGVRKIGTTDPAFGPDGR